LSGQTRHVPERLCAICRTSRPKPALVRLQRAAHGKIIWPPAGPARGKGLYLCHSAECLTRLFDEKRFRKQLVEPMDEECRQQLHGLLATLAEAGRQ
jgi:predicted RNA-binding protein YlxR (DUF448 family)